MLSDAIVAAIAQFLGTFNALHRPIAVVKVEADVRTPAHGSEKQ